VLELLFSLFPDHIRGPRCGLLIYSNEVRLRTLCRLIFEGGEVRRRDNSQDPREEKVTHEDSAHLTNARYLEQRLTAISWAALHNFCQQR
jgi:hypothetical protein